MVFSAKKVVNLKAYKSTEYKEGSISGDAERKKKRGFTLMELLVVISIITFLATIVLTGLDDASERTRNIRRITDAKEIQKAVELYAIDNNGKYFESPGDFWQTSSCNTTNWNTLADALSPYISSLPNDPAQNCGNPQFYRAYYYESDGNDYKILMHIPEDRTNPPADVFIDPRRDSGGDFCEVDGGDMWAWAIYTPGAKCW